MDELEKLRIKLKESYKREEQLEEENRNLRRIKFKSFHEEECWIFSKDGENYLESLVCPVVIDAGQLIEIRILLERINTGDMPDPDMEVELIDRMIKVLE